MNIPLTTFTVIFGVFGAVALMYFLSRFFQNGNFGGKILPGKHRKKKRKRRRRSSQKEESVENLKGGALASEVFRQLTEEHSED